MMVAPTSGTMTIVRDVERMSHATPWRMISKVTVIMAARSLSPLSLSLPASLLTLSFAHSLTYLRSGSLTARSLARLLAHAPIHSLVHAHSKLSSSLGGSGDSGEICSDETEACLLDSDCSAAMEAMDNDSESGEALAACMDNSLCAELLSCHIDNQDGACNPPTAYHLGLTQIIMAAVALFPSPCFFAH